MKMKLRQVPGSRRGFSLAETMVAILIMSFVGLIVTVGMMTALSVYGRIMDRANAELLLSTTLIELRDELDRAEEVVVDGSGNLLRYRNSFTGWRELTNELKSGPYTEGEASEKTAYSSKGIKIKEYQSYSASGTVTGDAIWNLLVSDAAATEKLYACCVDDDSGTQAGKPVITFSGTPQGGYVVNGVFTVKNLRVYKEGHNTPLARLAKEGTEEYKIRSLARVRMITSTT